MDPIRQFVIDRDDTFTAAVMQDDWDAVQRFVEKYGAPMPTNERVMKAGVYKAVQECTGIPEDVKILARQKCIELGFKPTMWEG